MAFLTLPLPRSKNAWFCVTALNAAIAQAEVLAEQALMVQWSPAPVVSTLLRAHFKVLSYIN